MEKNIYDELKRIKIRFIKVMLKIKNTTITKRNYNVRISELCTLLDEIKIIKECDIVAFREFFSDGTYHDIYEKVDLLSDAITEFLDLVINERDNLNNKKLEHSL